MLQQTAALLLLAKKMRIGSLAMFAVVGAALSVPPLAQPQEDKRAKPRSYYLTFKLPRFDGPSIDGDFRPSSKEVTEALKGLPCLPKNWKIYGNQFGDRREVQFWLLPRDSDLGDIAKALSKLGGVKRKPVAVINLAGRLPLEENEFATIKKNLAKAKGIDWDKSDRKVGLALDEAGGANFMEIRAAFKKAGVLETALDDK